MHKVRTTCRRFPIPKPRHSRRHGWFDAEIFSGTPGLRLQSIPPIQLSAEEQAFLDGPTHQLCAMINDWQVRHSLREIPEEIWDFVKKNGFLGTPTTRSRLFASGAVADPRQHRRRANSPDVVTIVMVATRCSRELIEKYDTDAQTRLPAAIGEGRGSAFGSDVGFGRCYNARRGTYQATDVWRRHAEKHYAWPKATLVGLAFRLFDRDNLLGKGDRWASRWRSFRPIIRE